MLARIATCVPRSVRTACRRDDDVPKGDVPRLAPLQIDWTRPRLVAVERATGNAGNLLTIDDGLPVQNNGHGAADQRDVIRLPLPCNARRGGRRRKEPIHRAETLARAFGLSVVLDLHFVSAPQVNTAVGIRCAVELDVQPEVIERRVADEIRATPGAHEHAILHSPRRARMWIADVPTRKV